MQQYEQRAPGTVAGRYDGRLPNHTPDVSASQLEVHHTRPVRLQAPPGQRIAGHAEAEPGEGYEGGDESESRGSGQSTREDGSRIGPKSS